MGMTCSACGEANRDGARFCFSCGVRLGARCATCDAELIEGARFCDECGAPTVPQTDDAPAASASARKTVTIVFADLQGSTALQERMDPESARGVMTRFYGAMRAVVDSHRGCLVKFVGDGVMAVFGVPDVAEDDARRALDAAAAMLDAVNALGLDIAMRVGVNTGEVVVQADDADVVGDVVNIASRLESAAPLGGVLVGESTWRLTREHASFGDEQQVAVKGRADPVTARLLLSTQSAPTASTSSFVGREVESHQLVALFDHAVASNTVQLAALIGSPGVGKSRLLHEFCTSVQPRATVLTARCDAATGATYGPIVDIIRAAADVAGGLEALLANDPDRQPVASAVGALLEHGRATTPEETFWAVRRTLAGLSAATGRSSVVVLDDLHWAEPLLLDLVEHLIEWLGSTPLLLVVAARPELRELRPALVEPGGRASVALALEGLDDGATTRLARDLLGEGSGALPVMLIARIVSATGGNPLYVRELLRMLVDDGVLRRDDEEGWQLTVDADVVEVPPTISALLEARIDRLTVDERVVLERAAVIGADVYRGLLVELLPAPVRRDVANTLESLRRKELLEPAGAYWVDEPILRFHHVLIRDAAYRRLLKEARADLHERVAGWLVGKAGAGAEHDELIGFHLEQAFHNRATLGHVDDATRVLATDAAGRLGRAGRHALDHDDLQSAATLIERALACVDSDDPVRGDLLIDQCESLLGSGNVTKASAAIDELAALGASSRRLAAWATCFDVQRITLRGGRVAELERSLVDAAASLHELGDPSGSAKAHRVHASVLARLGRVGDSEAALDRALTSAREANNQRQITNVLAAAPIAALWGPSPVPRAGGRCLDVVRLLRITTGAPEVEAISTRCQAMLEALRGRFDAARTLLTTSRRILEDRGGGHALLELDVACGYVEFLARDFDAADRFLERAASGLRALGAEADAQRATALRARVALDAGDLDRALAMADECSEADDDLMTAVGAWSVKAQVLVRRGAHDDAVQLARATVDLTARTDALVDHADACAALADVLELAGDQRGAREARQQAHLLYEQKAATVLAERVATWPEIEPSQKPPVNRRVLENEMTRFHEAICQSLLEGRVDPSWVLDEQYTYEDRRAGLGMELSAGERALTQLQSVVDAGLESVEHDVIAIRGERCALVKTTFHVAGVIVEPLVVLAMRPEGGGATVVFDADAIVDAIEELDRQFMAGEGARYRSIALFVGLSTAFNRRDWDALLQMYAPDVVSVDHRPVSHGTTVGVDSVVGRHRAFPEALPAALHIVRRFLYLDDDVAIAEDSGIQTELDFDRERLTVLQVRDGRVTRTEFFPVGDLEAAEALVQSWRSPGAELNTPARFDNAAARDMVRGCEAISRGDNDTLLRNASPDHVFEDRTTGLTRAADNDFERRVRVPSGQFVPTFLAIRGDRLVLATVRLTDPETGFVQDNLILTEVDELGHTLTTIMFDADDIAGAIAELERRHHQSMPPDVAATMALLSEVGAAFFAGDVERLAVLVADEFQIVDRVSGGYVMLDREQLLAWVANAHASGQQQYAEEVLTYDVHGAVSRIRRSEENAGGVTIESNSINLYFVANGQLALIERFSPDDAPAALARYAELTTDHGSLDNTAMRATFAGCEAMSRGEELIADESAPAVVFEDRSTGARRMVAGADWYSQVPVAGGQFTPTAIAIRDDHLALARVRFSDPVSGFAYDTLMVNETDELGRHIATIRFDADDLAGAIAELELRHRSSMPPAVLSTMELLARVGEAYNSGDLDAMASLVAPNFRVVDRTPATYRDLDREQASRWVATSHGDGQQMYTEEIFAIGESGAVSRLRSVETTETGGDIESRAVSLFLVTRGRLELVELFPVDGVDDALARFAELTRPPVHDNIAVRKVREAMEAIALGNLDALAALAAPELVFEDRRRGLRLELQGPNALGKHVRSVPMGAYTVEPIAVRGDRLALVRNTQQSGDADFFGSALMINEVDAAGLGVANILFDDADLDDAMAELDRRYQKSLDNAAVRNVRSGLDCIASGELSGLADLAVPDFFIDDRRTGLRFDFEGIDVLNTYAEAMPGVSHALEVIAVRGERLALLHMTPTANETEFAGSSLVINEVNEAGVGVANIIFDDDDLDAATAELDRRAAAIFNTTALRELRVALEAIRRGDVDQLTRSITPEFTVDDRRLWSRGEYEGAEVLRINVQDFRGGTFELEPVAVRGDRLALARLAQSTAESQYTRVSLAVVEIDDTNRAVVLVAFDEHDLDAATAEIDRRYAASHENAAVRNVKRGMDAIVRGDFDSIVGMSAPEFVLEDRRKGLRGEYVGGAEVAEYSSSMKGSTFDLDVLAIRGDLLALLRVTEYGTSGFSGSTVMINEVNEDGIGVANVLFDEDDLDEAAAELERRYVSGS